MSKTVKIVLISVASTLLCIVILIGLLTPVVVSEVKQNIRLNFGDDKTAVINTLDEMREPVFQTNYIITGLILSPDFQEFLDKGVINGWWTQDYLEQFLFDESLPILFNNYRFLLISLLTSDNVSNLVGQVNTVKSAIIQVINNAKWQLSQLLNSDKVLSLKQMISILQEDKQEITRKFNAIETTINKIDFKQISTLLVNLNQLIHKIENDGFEGIVNDILNNVLNSDAVQEILDDLQLTVDNIIKFINFYFLNFIDYDYDFNWYYPLEVGDKEIDLSKYALLLNVADIEINDADYTYDDGGTKLDMSDDTLIIEKVMFGFEINSKPNSNILSESIEINGANAIVIKSAIPKFNQLI